MWSISRSHILNKALPALNKPWEIIRKVCTGSKEAEDGQLVPSPACALQTNDWKQMLPVKNSLERSMWDAACRPVLPRAGVGLESGSPFLSLLLLALISTEIPVHWNYILTYTVSLEQELSSGFNGLMDSEEVGTGYQWHSDSEFGTQKDNRLPRHNACNCFPSWSTLHIYSRFLPPGDGLISCRLHIH